MMVAAAQDLEAGLPPPPEQAAKLGEEMSAPSPGADPMDPTPVRIGRYEILCELGMGGMASVHLARTIGLGGFERLFALKLIHPHLARDPAFLQMFLDEARMAARIRHPNVVPVYDVDKVGERYYISMDYISGETLGAALMETWPNGIGFPVELAAYIAAQAAEGLHAAHELRDADDQPTGVVHRDVSPQNIMLGYDGSVRVMDFGVAKAVDAAHNSRPGYFKGTIAYMSPEQIRSLQVDRRSDVFSLGVALWEATLGRRLFKASTELKTAQRVLSMPVPKPTDVDPRYPRRLERVVMRALERAPELRHPTARDLSDELADVCARSPVRPGAGELERFMERTFAARRRARKELERRAADMRIDVVEALDPSPAFDVAPAASLPPQRTDDLEPTAQATAVEAPAATEEAPATSAPLPSLAALASSEVNVAPPARVSATPSPEPSPQVSDDDDVPELDEALVRVVEEDVSPKPINREPTMIVRPRPHAEVTVRASVVPAAEEDDAEAWRPRTGPRLAIAAAVVAALGLGVWFAGRDANVAITLPANAIPTPATSEAAPSVAAPSETAAPEAAPSEAAPSETAPSEAAAPDPIEAAAPAPSPSPSAAAPPSPSPSPSLSPKPEPRAARPPSARTTPSAPRASPTPVHRAPPPMKPKPKSAPLFNGSDL